MSQDPKPAERLPQPPQPKLDAPAVDERHDPSCFGLEEEKGESWKGAGAAPPVIKDAVPTL